MGGKKKSTKKQKAVTQNVTKLSWHTPIVAKLKQKPREFMMGMTALLIVFLIPLSLLSKDYPQTSTQEKYPLQKVTPEVKSAQTKISAPEKKYYVVLQNESLWQIAEKVYGNGNMYVKLIELNPLPDPNNVEVGTKLLLN